MASGHAQFPVDNLRGAVSNLPFYTFPTVGEMVLPKTCALVGVEFLDDAVELPSFHHPRQAAYVMGPERNNLSPEMLALCDYVIRIPTKFCLNVGIARPGTFAEGKKSELA